MYAEMAESKTEPSGLDRMFYALQSFCVNLDEGLLPYLPVLMEKLFAALDPSNWSLQLKRVALNTLDAVAMAVKDKILPYFQKTIELLNVFLVATPENDIYELQCYAIGEFSVFFNVTLFTFIVSLLWSNVLYFDCESSLE